MIEPAGGPSCICVCLTASRFVRWACFSNARITNANSTNNKPMKKMCEKLGKFESENANAMSSRFSLCVIGRGKIQTMAVMQNIRSDNRSARCFRLSDLAGFRFDVDLNGFKLLTTLLNRPRVVVLMARRVAVALVRVFRTGDERPTVAVGVAG
jgi:hypothetical protein